jgi:hypothetical protein
MTDARCVPNELYQGEAEIGVNLLNAQNRFAFAPPKSPIDAHRNERPGRKAQIHPYRYRRLAPQGCVARSRAISRALAPPPPRGRVCVSREKTRRRR